MKPLTLDPEPARPADAARVVALQRACYRGEAELYGDPNLPPLTETVADLRAAMETHRVLVLRSGEDIVGAVRGYRDGATCRVGRLCVRENLRGLGLGARLLSALEASFPDVERFELFTGHRSVANLRFYRRAGYTESRRERLSPRIELVYLEKRLRPTGERAAGAGR